jgi:hypothetical protein
MTYTIAKCTVNKLLMMDGGTVRKYSVSCQNKFVKLVHLVGFIKKKSPNGYYCYEHIKKDLRICHFKLLQLCG